MPSFIKKTLYLFVGALLIISPFISGFVNTAQAATCTITDARFLNQVGNKATLVITSTTDCAGWQGNIQLEELDTYLDPDDNITSGFSFEFNTTGTVTDIELIIGERECDNISYPDCSVGAIISLFRNLPSGRIDGANYETDSSQTLRYNCKTENTCTNNIPWGIATASAAQECTVTKAIWNPAGFQQDYLKNAPNHNAVVQVIIDSVGCAGKTYFLDIVNQTRTPDAVVMRATVHAQSSQATSTSLLNFNAGEETCETTDITCQYFLKTSYQPPNGTLKTFSSESIPAGILSFKCFEACDKAWSSASLGTPVTEADHVTQAESVPPVQPNTVVVEPGSNPAGIDTNCTDDSGAPKAGCYTLDSGLSEILKMKTIDTSSLGGFINSIIAFIIGIAGVITVAMIMYDGFSYWSAGNSGNEIRMGEVKGRIWKRLLGLVLILSIYTILRTINPDLLNLVPRIDFAALSIDEAGDGEDANITTSDQAAAPTTKAKACPAGFTKVQVFTVCKTIEKNITNLLNAATTAGITLGGGGFRTYDSQVSLRKKNCGGSDNYSVFEKKASLCNPATAIPGTSRHESGLAFDFTCNGKGSINLQTRKTDTEVCFNWLKANASKYGLKNYYKENWHWSIDGH